MFATEIKLLPLPILHKHEETVLRGLDTLPTVYRNEFLDDPGFRYPLFYYLLLTHWPHLLNGSVGSEDLFYNRYYWLLRLVKQNDLMHHADGILEQQAAQMVETATAHFDLDALHDIEQRVAAETVTNEREIAVAYSEFSVTEVKKRFGLEVDETTDLFANVAPVAVGNLLADTLLNNIPLALAIGTEKARSELIIAPVLVEIRRQLANTISLFSGVEWNVDPAQGLRGVCDFLVSLSPEQFDVEAPVVTIVEAKKEDIGRGIGQCLAEMVAANIFNQERGNSISTIYGAVTTGNVWRFLKLKDAAAFVDVTEYHIKELERIVGILLSMVHENRSGPESTR